VTAADFLRFLLAWQHVDPAHHVEGPRGVLEVVRQLAGFEIPAAAWEREILAARVTGYRQSWLDELMLSGQVTWGRLWGAASGPVRRTPISLMPREQLDDWLGLTTVGDAWSLKGAGRAVHEQLSAAGALFPQEIERRGKLLPVQVEEGLGQLVGLGLASCDGFGGLRKLFTRRRRLPRRSPAPSGRWSLLSRGATDAPAVEFIARQLLRRTGVVFKRTLERERFAIPWWRIHRELRTLEARGEVRGGRFVEGFAGEQFALPEAVRLLRRIRNEDAAGRVPVQLSAADPLNFVGILTPQERVASSAVQRIQI
jgi:ATP-dependent Lhr-like helicase